MRGWPARSGWSRSSAATIPARFVALPFGGGGALHVGALIREVGLKAALVPRYPGVTSALGCVIADVRHDQVRTLNLALDTLDAAALDRAHGGGGRRAAQAVVAAAGLPVERSRRRSSNSTCIIGGQTHTVAVPLPVDAARMARPASRAAIVRAAFEAAYQPRLHAPAARASGAHRHAAHGGDRAAAGLRPGDARARRRRRRWRRPRAARRPVWFGGAWHEAAICARLDLPVGSVVTGPAILEQPDATVVVDPGLAARTDRFGNLIIERA